MEDCFIVCHAKDLGLPLSAGLVVYGKVWTDLGLSTSEVKGSLARFALINQKKDGFLSINDLAGFIGVSDGSVRDIFAAEDTDTMSFRRYLYAVVGPAKDLLRDEDFVKNIFKELDTTGNGMVELRTIYKVMFEKQLPSEEHPDFLSSSDSGSSHSDNLKWRRSLVKGAAGRQEEKSSGAPDSVSDVGKDNSSFNLDQFKIFLRANPEYLLLLNSIYNRN